MVEMCVRQDDGIDLGHRDRKPAILCVRFAAPALKHPAIEQDCVSTHPHGMTRTGHLAVRAAKLDVHASTRRRSERRPASVG